MIVSETILGNCRKHDRRAQEALYRLLYPEAFKVALRYSRDDQEAMDILNKAFFKALTRIETFQGNGVNFFGWLKRIVINQALDHQRATSFTRSFEPMESSVEEKGFDPFKEREDMEDVIALIQRLPATAACVFNLFAIDGFSHREIADRLGISEDNSRYHLSAARKQLKAWIFKTTEL